MTTSRSLANQGEWANLATGEAHVAWGSIVLAGAGAVLVLWAWKASNAPLMVMGLLVLLLGSGILVDVWAHGYQH